MSSGSSAIIGVRHGGRRVHPGSVGSLGCALAGSSGIAGFIGVRRDHQGSLLSLGCALVVVGYMRGRLVHWRTSWGSSGSSEAVAGFSVVHSGCRRIQLWWLG